MHNLDYHGPLGYFGRLNETYQPLLEHCFVNASRALMISMALNFLADCEAICMKGFGRVSDFVQDRLDSVMERVRSWGGRSVFWFVRHKKAPEA